MPEFDTYYASDTVGVLSTLQTEFNGGGLEIQKNSEITVYDEAHFFRDVAILTSVTPSDAAVPLISLADSMTVSSTIQKDMNTKILNTYVRIGDSTTYEFLVSAQSLYSVVAIIDTTRYRITSVPQQQAAGWTKDVIGTPTWTRDD